MEDSLPPLCHRCRREILPEEATRVVVHWFGSPLRLSKYRLGSFQWKLYRGRWALDRGWPYHGKCLPPNLFHKLAGSLPATRSRRVETP
jgi:hypothetical protein